MHRFILTLFAAATYGAALVLPGTIQAQVAPIVYAPGWNMVGGPPGMDFSGAQGLFAYHGGAYVPTDSARATACEGYWAYFAEPANGAVPATSSTAQTCSLQAGWTMVGDPFDDVAALPAGTIALDWDPGTQSYGAETTIPVGHAVWIWSPSGGSILLASAAAGGVTVSAPPPPRQPVTLHVGQYLTLLVPLGNNGPSYVAHADVPHLQFIDGSPLAGTSSYAYRWKAVSAGDADVTLDPACLAAGCALPSFVVRVSITA